MRTKRSRKGCLYFLSRWLMEVQTTVILSNLIIKSYANPLILADQMYYNLTYDEASFTNQIFLTALSLG